MVVERQVSPEINRFSVREVVVAGNFGPCKGVDMAIDVGEVVMQEVGGREPVFLTNPIVHNLEVMEEFYRMGAIMVDKVEDIPRNSIWINSAHAHTPSDFEAAKSLELVKVDTVCPLVNKTYVQGKRAVSEGAQIAYLGSRKKDGSLHPESRGFLGQIDTFGGEVKFIGDKSDLESVQFDPNRPIRILNQTTLATDEFRYLAREIKEMRPDAVMNEGICYATDNRQKAVIELAESVDAFLISGSHEISHNTKMLAQRAQMMGKRVVHIETETDLSRDMFPDINRLGYSAGASVRDKTSIRVLEWFSRQGVDIQYALPAGPEPGKAFRWPAEDLENLREHLKGKYGS